MPLFSDAQGGVVFAQRQQRPHVCEYILLFGGAAAGGEGVPWIAGETSREVTAIVGVDAARQNNFVAGINLWNPAQGQQQRQCGFQFGGVAVFFTHEARVVVIPDEGDQRLRMRVKLIVPKHRRLSWMTCSLRPNGGFSASNQRRKKQDRTEKTRRPIIPSDTLSDFCPLVAKCRNCSPSYIE